MQLIIETFVLDGVQEEYDDVRNVGEYMSEVFGMLLTPFYLTLNFHLVFNNRFMLVI